MTLFDKTYIIFLMKPWKTKARNTVLDEQPWLTVEHHTVELPDGRLIPNWLWIMTPEYIKKSLDVFPIEFLNFRLTHQTLLGEDILVSLEIDRGDLKRQCEREVKGKLIWLRQGYISSMGNRRMLADNIIRQFTGYMPLFRGLIQLLGEDPPVNRKDVVAVLSRLTGTDTDIFEDTYAMKKKVFKPTLEQLHTLFEKYYYATERLLEVVYGLET